MRIGNARRKIAAMEDCQEMKKLMVVAAVAAVLVAGLVVFFALRGEPSGVDEERGGSPSRAPRIASAAPVRKAGAANGAADAANKAAKRKIRFVRIRAEDRKDLPAGERRLLAAIESAVDDEDFKSLQRVVAEAGASTNPEVRGGLVEALGWFGKEALLDLLPFMADADADVAQSAIDNWTTALADVEDEKVRSSYVVNAMKVLTDKESLDAMIMQLDDCDDVVGMQALVDVIESKNKAAADVAREHYEFKTGEQYVDFDTASEWITKNYVPDDDADKD